MKKNWISIHIFYYGDQNYLIVNCVAPLVAELREQGLIQRFFFIKYWVEGLHVRLRFLPASDADEEKIKYMAELAISAFLKQHPALYKLNMQKVAPIYKKMYIAEYGEEKWAEIYGREGIMPLRPNNSFEYIEYEPEYARYGGSEGVELAEWHFEHSSDTVIGLLREVNVNVQSILLGRSIQLVLPFFYGMFENDDKVIKALDRYITYGFGIQTTHDHQIEQYAKRYQHMAPMLQHRIAMIRRYMLEEHASSRLTETEFKWKKHISELRQNIDRLYNEQKIKLNFEHWPNRTFVLDDVYHHLQTSYVHMTNNRLGVLIPQEIYITYLLKRTLQDLLGEDRKEAV